MAFGVVSWSFRTTSSARRWLSQPNHSIPQVATRTVCGASKRSCQHPSGYRSRWSPGPPAGGVLVFQNYFSIHLGIAAGRVLVLQDYFSTHLGIAAGLTSAVRSVGEFSGVLGLNELLLTVTSIPISLETSTCWERRNVTSSMGGGPNQEEAGGNA